MTSRITTKRLGSERSYYLIARDIQAATANAAIGMDYPFDSPGDAFNALPPGRDLRIFKVDRIDTIEITEVVAP